MHAELLDQKTRQTVDDMAKDMKTRYEEFDKSGGELQQFLVGWCLCDEMPLYFSSGSRSLFHKASVLSQQVFWPIRRLLAFNPIHAEIGRRNQHALHLFFVNNKWKPRGWCPPPNHLSIYFHIENAWIVFLSCLVYRSGCTLDTSVPIFWGFQWIDACSAIIIKSFVEVTVYSEGNRRLQSRINQTKHFHSKGTLPRISVFVCSESTTSIYPLSFSPWLAFVLRSHAPLATLRLYIYLYLHIYNMSYIIWNGFMVFCRRLSFFSWHLFIRAAVLSKSSEVGRQHPELIVGGVTLGVAIPSSLGEYSIILHHSFF